MSNTISNTIANRLSLRPPQRESLKILKTICDIIPLEKDADLQNQLEIVQSEYPHIKSFDRDFISLCFALATGVGKTRLMGAFISYLHLSENIRHFFVLAPNLTIYNKLKEDFSPGSPKYVFKGIGELVNNPPIIITGDNYESGLGVREDTLFTDNIHINIFNIAKITDKANKGSSLAKDDENRKVPRMRRLREEMGESYFEYLSGLDDLVVLMDESHRYRADAGMAAINELKPLLGIELTATPQVEKSGNKSITFENIIYSYPLSSAMDDGFVKEPAVATRENFKKENYTDENLERIKLEDGIHIHENTKVELEVYARNNSLEIVKPFLLVVAQDTNHANDIQRLIESEDFFDRRYRGKVITVHSKNSGREGDEVIQQLLTVENRTNPIEIVVHVNMLKEGWDVTNLYTIVPLRAANSKTLVEQSIGRGLRLPYGKRTGVEVVDRLTIVSHDRFQEIIDHANDPGSIIHKGIVIGRDIPDRDRRVVNIESSFDHKIKSEKSERERTVAKATYSIFREFEGLSSSTELETPEVQEQIVERVKEVLSPQKETFDFEQPELNFSAIVSETTSLYRSLSIDIPRIVVLPVGDSQCGYRDFNLDTSGISIQPDSQDILIKHLHDQKRYTLNIGSTLSEESRPENYIVRGLTEFDDISYDDHCDIINKLASQLVNHLRTYLPEDKVLNVLQGHQKVLVNLIHVQMKEHFIEEAANYEAHVTRGFHTLRSSSSTLDSGEESRNFRDTIAEGERNRIKSMLFGNFQKCLYPNQKFDSDSERRFSIILEDEASVLKWFKPSPGDFQIYYNSQSVYEPDFVVETETMKYLIEPKRASEMTDEIVLAKSEAAVIWCKNASSHAREHEQKEWVYLLIPHNEITEQMTLAGLIERFKVE